MKSAVNEFLEYLGEEYFMDLKFEVITEERDGSPLHTYIAVVVFKKKPGFDYKKYGF